MNRKERRRQERLARKNPDRGAGAAGTLQVAARYFQAGQPDQAARILEDVRRAEPENFDATLGLAIVRATEGELDAAIPLFEKAAAIRPGDAEAHYNLGKALQDRGRTDDAVAAYRRALEINPADEAGHVDLGNLLKDTGDMDGAAACYRRALAVTPAHAVTLTNLGNALQALGELDEAIASHRRALEISPDQPLVLSNLGNALQAQGHLAEAEASHRRALAIAPGNANVLGNLGRLLMKLERTDEAMEAFTRAAAIEPDSTSVLTNLAILKAERGERDEALALYRRVLALKPDDADAYHEILYIKKFKPGDPDLAAMEKLRGTPSLEAEKAMFLDFSIAKAYDDIGDYDRAFEHMASGNRLKRSVLGYDWAEQKALVDRIIGVFDDAFLAGGEGSGLEEERPVFIVGMPRSGSTLIEQMLASHSRVFGAGEISRLLNVVVGARDDAGPGIAALSGRNRQFPEGVADIDRTARRQRAETYLARLCRDAGDAARITDKTLKNYLLIGLIHLALPEARIIHCVRNPMDTCLSCYQRHFVDGQQFSYDLTSLGLHFREYARLMDHWRAVLPERLLDVRYEDLVAAPEEGIKALLDFCGLEWEEGCLAFHETERVVRTASAQQVREPIYRTAVQRWRHYEKHLGPLIEALGPLAEGA
ncbi:MAG: sulfotransferase [Rhodospirillales bacterium]